MYALVKRGPSPGIDYVEIDVPQPTTGEVLVQVEAAAICGSDLNFYRCNAWAEEVVPDFPFTPGHEGCGTVVELGRDVHRLTVGDQVAIETHIPCGQCWFMSSLLLKLLLKIAGTVWQLSLS